MIVDHPDDAVAPIAAAIGEPARARILYLLLDGRAHTSTELAAVAQVAPSTASSHLRQLTTQRLVEVVVQGKHRYYTLHRPEVAAALEALSVVAGGQPSFTPRTPPALRTARTCYDHLAGTLGVALYDRFTALGWIEVPPRNGAVDVTVCGRAAFTALGINIDGLRTARRRFAFACLDWSERRPHLGGAVAAAVLDVLRRRRWIVADPDSRIVRVTPSGTRELAHRFGVVTPARNHEGHRARR